MGILFLLWAPTTSNCSLHPRFRQLMPAALGSKSRCWRTGPLGSSACTRHGLRPRATLRHIWPSLHIATGTFLSLCPSRCPSHFHPLVSNLIEWVLALPPHPDRKPLTLSVNITKGEFWILQREGRLTRLQLLRNLDAVREKNRQRMKLYVILFFIYFALTRSYLANTDRSGRAPHSTNAMIAVYLLIIVRTTVGT